MSKSEEENKFYYVTCDAFKAFNINLNDSAEKYEMDMAVIAMRSSRPIKHAMKAIEKSPFQTVFIVSEKTGEIGFALTKNKEYAEAAKKKGGGGKVPPKLPPSPAEDCCAICMAMGADGCMTLENMNCYCLFEGGGGSKEPGGINTNEPLEHIWP